MEFKHVLAAMLEYESDMRIGLLAVQEKIGSMLNIQDRVR